LVCVCTVCSCSSNSSRPTSGTGKWVERESKKVYYVQVQVDGKTKEDAIQKAFKEAVTQAVGALVISETEVRNKEVIRQEILNYSSGYIDDYKILRIEEISSGVEATVDVWVIESQISDRIKSVGKTSTKIDGKRASVQQETLIKTRKESSELLNLALNDFPKNAFETQLISNEIGLNGLNSELNLKVFVRWNDSYIKAVTEVLEATSNSIWTSKETAARIVYTTTDSMWSKTANYKDREVLDDLRYKLLRKRIALQIKIKDKDEKEIVERCYTFNHNFYAGETYDQTIKIKTDFKIDSRSTSQLNINMNFGQDSKLVKQFDHIDVDINEEKNSCLKIVEIKDNTKKYENLFPIKNKSQPSKINIDIKKK